MRLKKLSVIVLIIISVLTMSGYTGYSDEYVYLGGFPVGVVQESEGVIIYDFSPVQTKEGVVSPAKESGLLKGDLIIKINGESVKSGDDIGEKVKSGTTLKVEVMRGSASFIFTINPVKDKYTGNYKIGLIPKNELTGIGTMTFIKADGHFGAIGHKIYDDNVSVSNDFQKGTLYTCSITGLVKGSGGKIGHLKGAFEKNTDKCGIVNSNTSYGLFGKTDISPDNLTLIPVGNMNDVSVGRAEIYSTLSGKKSESYAVEIVKAEKQSGRSVKSMVIRVIDDRLIETAGGIIQGMSGSPIVQNGRIIGAVTHVFTGNPLYGYGIYIDWMIDMT